MHKLALGGGFLIFDSLRNCVRATVFLTLRLAQVGEKVNSQLISLEISDLLKDVDVN